MELATASQQEQQQQLAQQVRHESQAARAQFEKLTRMSGDDMVQEIFSEFIPGGAAAIDTGRLNMEQYGQFLRAISYSKPWTAAQFEKECAAIGADAAAGVGFDNLMQLYRAYRSRKLRADYARILKLPAELFRAVLDDKRPVSLSGRHPARSVLTASGVKLCLRAAQSAGPGQLDVAAQLLHQEWQGAGGLAGRLRVLGQQAGSFILLDENAGTVVGHCRLRAAAESTSDETAGKNGVVTSVVVAPGRRREGCGSAMLRLLQESAAGSGYCYLYLAPAGCAGSISTADQLGFFAGAGYMDCGGGVVLEAECLKALDATAVQGLERLFASRFAAAAADPEAAASADKGAVGLRMQLKEELPMTAHSPSRLEEAILAQLHAGRLRVGSPEQECDGERTSRWEAEIPLGKPVSLTRQVGPSCGLVVLRMAAAALLPVAARPSRCGGLPGGESLLQLAISSGFSKEGEVFDIEHLKQLATAGCGLEATVVSLQSAEDSAAGGTASGLGPAELAAELRAGGLVALPYDRDQAGGGRPCCRGGHSAHYALLIGLATRGGGEGGPVDGSAEGGADKLVFAAVHGMAASVVVAEWADWSRSNRQLGAARPDQIKAGRWVFPVGGVPNLAGKCLLLRRPKRAPSKGGKDSKGKGNKGEANKGKGNKGKGSKGPPPPPPPPPPPESAGAGAVQSSRLPVSNRWLLPENPTLCLGVPRRVQLGEVGCGLYALGMAMDFWHSKDPGQPVALVKAMDRAVGAQDGGRLHNPEPTTEELLLDAAQRLGTTGYGECYAASHLLELALHFGYDGRLHKGASLQQLLRVVEAGRPALVCVDIDLDTAGREFQPSEGLAGQHTHWVVVDGYHHDGRDGGPANALPGFLMVQQSGKRAPSPRTIWSTDEFARSWLGTDWAGRHRRRRMPAAVAERLRLEPSAGAGGQPRLLFDAGVEPMEAAAVAAFHAELAAAGLLELAGEGRVRLAEGAELHHAHELRQAIVEIFPR